MSKESAELDSTEEAIRSEPPSTLAEAGKHVSAYIAKLNAIGKTHANDSLKATKESLGAAIRKLASREGATLGESLRRAFTGATLGQSNASKETTRRVENYNLGLITNFTPGAAGAVLDDAEAGTPQHFLWFAATDPSIPKRPDPAGQADHSDQHRPSDTNQASAVANAARSLRTRRPQKIRAPTPARDPHERVPSAWVPSNHPAQTKVAKG